MKRRTFIAAPLLVLAAHARADDGYPSVVPGRTLHFPRDHGSHPEFRIEWWYVTGWVSDAAGATYGVQVTFFRNRTRLAGANPSAFSARELVFAHAALVDPEFGRVRHDQRAARAAFGLAGAEEATTRVWIDDWSLALVDDAYAAKIVGRDFAFDLRFAVTQPLLANGEAGYSRKGPQPSQASYYYSRPQLRVSGTISAAGNEIAVTGTAWLDHEWSSEMMAREASGWDWAGLNLVDGGAVMAFRMRDAAGGTVWAGGTLRTPGGDAHAFAPSDVRFAPRRRWRSPRTGIEYPVAMTLAVPGAEFALDPMIDDQELDSRASTGTIYWEGAVRALQSGREAGRGYLELTGYGTPLRL